MTKSLDRYSERVQRVVDYVAGHLDRSLGLETLAEVAHLSPYHFHRIYRALLGETVNDTVRRLRLQRSALDLLDRELNIERVAQRAGYSSHAAFSRAFRAEYGDPPARYRDAQRLVELDRARPDLYEVERMVLPRLRVGVISHRGDYQLTSHAFERLMTIAATTGLLTPATRTLGIYHDDPASVPQNELRSSACITVPETWSSAGEIAEMHIEGGRYARIVHAGPYPELRTAYDWLYQTWLPDSGEELRNLPCLEEYLNHPRQVPAKDLQTAVLLPLEGRTMPRVYENLNVESDFGGRFPWKSQRIDVGAGIQQAVVDEGPRTAPVTFVLLHGNPTWGFLYRKFIAALASDYRVVVPDHVGFGRSDKPQDPAYYSLERHIANLTITLEQLNVTRAVLVMQDWGGPIGMGWATRHAARVAGFVVLNTWAFVEQPAMKLPWLFKFLVLGKGGWKRATQSNTFTEMFLIRGSRLDAATAAAYRAPHPTPDERIGIARFPQLIPETANPAHESRRTMAAIESALPSIADRPALLMWAQKDRAFNPAQLRRWQTLFRNLDGPHLLPTAGHFSQEDAPDEILPRLRAWADAQFRGTHA